MSADSRRDSRLTGVIAVLVLGGYVGFELFGLHRVRDDVTPEAIYRDFVGARRAVAVCDTQPPERADFERNFRVVAAQARADLAERRPDASEEELAAALGTLRAGREAEVDALIEAQGCDGKDVWRLQKLYEVRSRLNLRR